MTTHTSDTTRSISTRSVDGPSRGWLVAGLAAAVTSIAGQIIGTSLDTDFTQGARGNVTPDAITFYGHWVNTIPWYWAGAGLALAVAGFRHGVLPRWLAVVSLVLGLATTLFAVSPLEYMAAVSGTLWLLVTTIGLLAARSGPAQG